MHIYRCKVLLGSNEGTYTTGVFRDVTAPELIVLQRIHGDQFINNVEPLRSEPVNHDEERKRLSERYGAALMKLKPPVTIESIFGASYQELPLRVGGVQHPPEPVVKPEPIKPKRRGRPPKPAEADEVFA